MNGFMAESGGRSAGHPAGQGARRKFTADERMQRTRVSDDPQEWKDDIASDRQSKGDIFKKWLCWGLGPFALITGVMLITDSSSSSRWLGGALIFSAWVAARVNV